MPRLSFTVPLGGKTAAPKDRGSIFEILSIPDTGASPRGSTYRKSLLQCPHEHGLLYEIGLRPESPTEALTIGLLFHYALQRYYESIFAYQREFAVKWRIDHPTDPWGYRKQDGFFFGNHAEASAVSWKAIRDLENADGYKETWATLSRTVDAYLDHYSFRDRWEIVAVEETVEYYGSASGSFDHTARLDLIIIDWADGRVYNVEHKTARWISQDLVDFYDLDLQILGQVWLAMRCIDWAKAGLPMFGGCKINIASKQKTPVLIRHDVIPSVQALEAFERMLGQWENIRGVYAKADWPKALGQCAGAARGYSKCQFYELCRAYPLETVTTVGKWRDPPSGFVVRGVDAPTIEDRDV
jgi:PD-(D/E)XK nuclease superfamily